jgi:hypothetical protein
MEKGFFSEDPNRSLMRIGFFLCVVSGCIIGLLSVILDRDLTGAGVLCGAIIGTAMGGKAIQKKYEHPCDMDKPL